VFERQDAEVAHLAANHAMSIILAGPATALCVAGTWRGRPVEIGTALVARRDFDTPISYVCAVDRAVPAPFRIATRIALDSFPRLGAARGIVTTGDVAFDDRWSVDADESLARAVLDSQMRAWLLELQARLPWIQVAMVESTPFGVVVRWWGELPPEGAATPREVALAVHDRLARAPRLACAS
jgi:hypothetical protein